MVMVLAVVAFSTMTTLLLLVLVLLLLLLLLLLVLVVVLMCLRRLHHAALHKLLAMLSLLPNTIIGPISIRDDIYVGLLCSANCSNGVAAVRCFAGVAVWIWAASTCTSMSMSMRAFVHSTCASMHSS